jgi:hypothetical protein
MNPDRCAWCDCAESDRTPLVRGHSLPLCLKCVRYLWRPCNGARRKVLRTYPGLARRLGWKVAG